MGGAATDGADGAAFTAALLDTLAMLETGTNVRGRWGVSAHLALHLAALIVRRDLPPQARRVLWTGDAARGFRGLRDCLAFGELAPRTVLVIQAGATAVARRGPAEFDPRAAAEKRDAAATKKPPSHKGRFHRVFDKAVDKVAAVLPRGMSSPEEPPEVWGPPSTWQSAEVPLARTVVVCTESFEWSAADGATTTFHRAEAPLEDGEGARVDPGDGCRRRQLRRDLLRRRRLRHARRAPRVRVQSPARTLPRGGRANFNKEEDAALFANAFAAARRDAEDAVVGALLEPLREVASAFKERSVAATDRAAQDLAVLLERAGGTLSTARARCAVLRAAVKPVAELLGRAAEFSLTGAVAAVRACALRKVDRFLSKADTKAGLSAAALVDNLALIDGATHDDESFAYLVGMHLDALRCAAAVASATLRYVGANKADVDAFGGLAVGAADKVCAALRAHRGGNAASTSAAVCAAVAAAVGIVRPRLEQLAAEAASKAGLGDDRDASSFLDGVAGDSVSSLSRAQTAARLAAEELATVGGILVACDALGAKAVAACATLAKSCAAVGGASAQAAPPAAAQQALETLDTLEPPMRTCWSRC